MSSKIGLVAAALSAYTGVDVVPKKSREIDYYLNLQERSELLAPPYQPPENSQKEVVEQSYHGGKLSFCPYTGTLIFIQSTSKDEPVKVQGQAGLSRMREDGFFGGICGYYIDDATLDEKFDYDFTNLRDDRTRFERGGYTYQRPYGWNRVALKVLGKHSDDDWLGEQGIRTGSSAGEWAVSYHGSKADNCLSIASGGYDPRKRVREMFGPGFYSTPSIQVAALYATEFTHEGKKYKMVMQNRVNLAESEVIPASHTGEGAEYFVTLGKDNIRCYGICCKEI